MKTSVELSIELLDAKIVRVSGAIEAINSKAAKILEESSKQQKILDKLKEEKVKLLNSKAYKKTEVSQKYSTISASPENILLNAAKASDV